MKIAYYNHTAVNINILRLQSWWFSTESSYTNNIQGKSSPSDVIFSSHLNYLHAMKNEDVYIICLVNDSHDLYQISNFLRARRNNFELPCSPYDVFSFFKSPHLWKIIPYSQSEDPRKEHDRNGMSSSIFYSGSSSILS